MEAGYKVGGENEDENGESESLANGNDTAYLELHKADFMEDDDSEGDSVQNSQVLLWEASRNNQK